MAHRSIGQERFGFAGRTRSASSLDALGKLIDWASVAALLDPLYSARAFSSQVESHDDSENAENQR